MLDSRVQFPFLRLLRCSSCFPDSFSGIKPCYSLFPDSLDVVVVSQTPSLESNPIRIIYTRINILGIYYDLAMDFTCKKEI